MHDSGVQPALPERFDRRTIRHREPQAPNMVGSRHDVARQQPDREIAPTDEDVWKGRFGGLDREMLVFKA